MHARFPVVLLAFALFPPSCSGRQAVHDDPHGHAPDAAVATSKSGCDADANHCCMKDGAIVKPGGCQPDYPDNVRPATERGADGYCQPIECYLKCLPATARIATPSGDVPVAELHAGDLVWTVDAHGARAAAPVARVSSVEVGAGHALVELTLADGRVVRASAGHPTSAGVPIGDLAVGAQLDGTTVVGMRMVPHDDDRTWDLLPAGATGTYWADGVLLGSTLWPR